MRKVFEQIFGEKQLKGKTHIHTHTKKRNTLATKKVISTSSNIEVIDEAAGTVGCVSQ